ncbi:hypothetical protein HZH66_011913 [Vespula vulgaris]|uniref:Uncharacterized protein n=1 Tax=Vespula vulgaris TaxID=7454 RepID=A0A834JIG4_VESVU|nr:hypothetical protein HZH66_011913 [Vespula vulgaris]
MPVGIPGAFISRRDSFLETPLSRTDDADVGPSRKRGRDNAAAPNSHLTPRDSSTREPGIPDGLCFFENLSVRSPSKRDRTSLEGYGRPARSTKRPTLSEGSTTSSRTPTDRDTWKQKHRASALRARRNKRLSKKRRIKFDWLSERAATEEEEEEDEEEDDEEEEEDEDEDEDEEEEEEGRVGL